MAFDPKMILSIVAKDFASGSLKTVAKTASTAAKTMRSGFQRVGNAFKSVFRSIFSLKAGILGLMASAGLLLSFKGISNWAKKEADAIEDLRLQAVQLGITFSELEKLEFFGRMVQVSLPALANGVRYFQRSVAESDKFVKMLGLTLRDSDGRLRNTTDLFLEAGEAIMALPDAAQRTQLAMELFGRSGVSMLAAFSQDMRLFDRDWERFGERRSAQTVQMAQDFTRARLRMAQEIGRWSGNFAESLRPMMTAAMNAIGEFMVDNRDRAQAWFNLIVPSFKQVASAVQATGEIFILFGFGAVEAFDSIRTGIIRLQLTWIEFQKLVRSGADYVVAAFKYVQLGINWLEKSFWWLYRQIVDGSVWAAQKILQEFSDSALKTALILEKIGAPESFVESIAKAGFELGKVNKAVEEGGRLFGAYADKKRAEIEASSDLIRSELKAWKEGQSLFVEQDDLASRSMKLWGELAAVRLKAATTGWESPAMQAWMDRLNEIVSLIAGVKVETAEASEETRKLTEPSRLTRWDQTWKGVNRTLDQVFGKLSFKESGFAQGMEQYLATFVNMTQRIAGVVAGGFQAIEASLVSSMEGILNRSKTWKDLLNDLKNTFVQTLIRMAAQLLIIIPLAILFNVLTGGSLSVIGTANTAAAIGSAGGLAGAYAQTQGAQPQGQMAEGGIAWNDGIYRLAERDRPEAVVPLRNGSIPVAISGAGGARQEPREIVVNLNIVSPGGITPETLPRLKPFIVDTMREAMTSDVGFQRSVQG